MRPKKKIMYLGSVVGAIDELEPLETKDARFIYWVGTTLKILISGAYIFVFTSFFLNFFLFLFTGDPQPVKANNHRGRYDQLK